MGKDPAVDRLRGRYARLANRLGKVRLLLQGTITQRTLVRPSPSPPKRKKRYGPYYQWTWKHAGKTVTVNLTATQARAYQRAIDNHRKLERRLGEMRALSLQILEATTVSVKRRKPRTQPPRA